MSLTTLPALIQEKHVSEQCRFLEASGWRCGMWRQDLAWRKEAPDAIYICASSTQAQVTECLLQAIKNLPAPETSIGTEEPT